MKKFWVIALALGLVLGVAMTAGAANFCDDFNRPDGALGANWTTYGSIGISGNRAASTSFGEHYAVVKGFSGSYLTTKLSVDAVSTSTSLNYVALVLGYADANHNIFVKVQDQSGLGQYGNAAFYYGNNGAGSFFAIPSFDVGRISVYALDANTIQLDIDSDFDGIANQTYSYAYSDAQIGALGTGIGLGMYGPALADNYCANAVVTPLPGALLLFGSGLLGLTGLRWRRK